MSEENQTPPPPRTCERVAAACEALKTNPDENKYRRLLGALEADVLEGRVGFLPIAQDDVARLQATGEVKWTAVKTPAGTMLVCFTSADEASRGGAGGALAVPLGIFLQTLMQNKEFTGLFFNPSQAGSGVAIPKEHAEKVLAQVQVRSQRLDQPVVVDALWRLWDRAAGVPFPYKDVREEVQDLGGVDRVMGPVMMAWKKRFDAGEFKDSAPLAVMKEMATDVLRYALAAAVGAKVRPGLFDGKTPYEWLKEDVVEADGESLEEEVWLFLDGAEPPPEKTVRLRDDLKANVDLYIDILSENLRAQGLVKDKDGSVLGQSMLANAGPVCFGLMSFGIGWGTALYLESRGPEAVAQARARQEQALAAAGKKA